MKHRFNGWKTRDCDMWEPPQLYISLALDAALGGMDLPGDDVPMCVGFLAERALRARRVHP